jgi:hypothetical protein
MESRDRIRHHNRQQERDAGQYLLGDCVECCYAVKVTVVRTCILPSQP